MLKVLIIDDNYDDCREIEKVLRNIYNENEISVYHAQNYFQAQQIIYSSRIDIDILFVDVILNSEDVVNNGIIIIEEMLQYRNNLPFIIISGHYFETIKQVNKKLLGFNQYIGFLDKGDYSEDDVLDVIVKANTFITDVHSQNAKILNQIKIGKNDNKMELHEFLKLIVKNLSFEARAIADLEYIYHQDKKLYHMVLDFLGNYDRNPNRFVSEKFHVENGVVFEIKKTLINKAIRFFISPLGGVMTMLRIIDHPETYKKIKEYMNHFFLKEKIQKNRKY